MSSKTKEVRIVLRNGWEMEIPMVEVLWECPTCGQPMGEPEGHNFYEDGDSYHCNIWTNPCGHVAMYYDLKMLRKDRTFATWKEILEERKK